MVHWRLTPKELGALPFSSFLQMAQAAKEEADRQTMNAAFTAWLMGAGNGKDWKPFCEHYGLIETPDPKVQKEKDRKDAERIWAEHMALKRKTTQWQEQSLVS